MITLSTLGRTSLPRHLLDKLLSGLINTQGCKAYLLGISAADTDFTYQIQTDMRFTLKRLTELRAYVAGYITALS